jgi:hypothetical protein
VPNCFHPALTLTATSRSRSHSRSHSHSLICIRYAPPDKGQLAEQLRRAVLGEELLSNGPKPKVEEDDEEEETMEAPDGSDDDLGLGW